LETPKFFKPN